MQGQLSTFYDRGIYPR